MRMHNNYEPNIYLPGWFIGSVSRVLPTSSPLCQPLRVLPAMVGNKFSLLVLLVSYLQRQLLTISGWEPLIIKPQLLLRELPGLTSERRLWELLHSLGSMRLFVGNSSCSSATELVLTESWFKDENNEEAVALIPSTLLRQLLLGYRSPLFLLDEDDSAGDILQQVLQLGCPLVLPRSLWLDSSPSQYELLLSMAQKEQWHAIEKESNCSLSVSSMLLQVRSSKRFSHRQVLKRVLSKFMQHGWIHCSTDITNDIGEDQLVSWKPRWSAAKSRCSYQAQVAKRFVFDFVSAVDSGQLDHVFLPVTSKGELWHGLRDLLTDSSTEQEAYIVIDSTIMPLALLFAEWYLRLHAVTHFILPKQLEALPALRLVEATEFKPAALKVSLKKFIGEFEGNSGYCELLCKTPLLSVFSVVSSKSVIAQKELLVQSDLAEIKTTVDNEVEPQKASSSQISVNKTKALSKSFRPLSRTSSSGDGALKYRAAQLRLERIFSSSTVYQKFWADFVADFDLQAQQGLQIMQARMSSSRLHRHLEKRMVNFLIKRGLNYLDGDSKLNGDKNANGETFALLDQASHVVHHPKN